MLETDWAKIKITGQVYEYPFINISGAYPCPLIQHEWPLEDWNVIFCTVGHQEIYAVIEDVHLDDALGCTGEGKARA